MPADTPNRRALLTGTTAGVATVALDVAPFLRTAAAQSFVDHPDAALLALGRAWAASVIRCKEADALRDAVASSYTRPDEPEAILWRDSDAETFPGLEPDEGLFGRPAQRRQGFFKHRTFDAIQVALPEMKERAAFARDTPPIAAIGARLDRRIARVEEILAADAAWKKESHERWLAAGMKEAEDAAEEAESASRELRLKIIHTPAASREGILLKARVAADCFGDTPADVEAAIREHMDDWSGSTVALSILLDLLRTQSLGLAAT